MQTPQLSLHQGDLLQVVICGLNPRFPEVVKAFQVQANRTIGQIMGTGMAIVIPETQEGESFITVVKITTWQDQYLRDKVYRTHPALRQWCLWLLHGWMIRGTTETQVGARIDEVIAAVVGGKVKRDMIVRDTEAEPDDTKVPWLGEHLANGTNVLTVGPGV